MNNQAPKMLYIQFVNISIVETEIQSDFASSYSQSLDIALRFNKVLKRPSSFANTTLLNLMLLLLYV